MSFFDEGDEPTRVDAPPGRASGRAGGGGACAPGASPTARPSASARPSPRRSPCSCSSCSSLGVKGCLDAARRTRSRTTTATSTAVVSDSDQRGRPAALPAARQRRAHRQDLQIQVNQLRVRRRRRRQARARLRRARRHEGRAAQPVLTLDLRADGPAQDRRQISGRAGPRPGRRRTRSRRSPAQMQAFLASDVVYTAARRRRSSRRRSTTTASAASASPTAASWATSRGWPATTVAAAPRRGARGAAGRSRQGRARPARPRPDERQRRRHHAAARAGVVNRVPATAEPDVHGELPNQGDNDENDVQVPSRSAAAGKTITATQDGRPDQGRRRRRRSTSRSASAADRHAATVTVAIAPVRGEKKTDNNRQTLHGHLHALARPRARGSTARRAYPSRPWTT